MDICYLCNNTAVPQGDALLQERPYDAVTRTLLVPAWARPCLRALQRGGDVLHIAREAHLADDLAAAGHSCRSGRRGVDVRVGRTGATLRASPFFDLTGEVVRAYYAFVTTLKKYRCARGLRRGMDEGRRFRELPSAFAEQPTRGRVARPSPEGVGTLWATPAEAGQER